MKRLFLLFILGALLIPGLFAQEEPTARLVYFDDDVSLRIYDEEEIELFPDFDMEVLPGYTIETGDSNVELELVPNGSIIKLTPGTTFVVEDIQGRTGAPSNSFALLKGKLRAVAARAVGDETYSIRTPTSVAGVRGTDFGMEYLEGVMDSTFVQEGLVSFTQSSTGQSVDLAAGMIADTFAAVFEAIEIPAAEMSNLFGNLGFDKLNPGAVPGKAPIAAVTEPEPEPEPEVEPEPEPEKEPDDTAAEESWLGQLLGLEIGSITIGDTTYSKALIQPEFEIGKLKMGLYLPVIYTKDILDPNDWYHPKGNDEWSFGTDQEGTREIVADVVNDLFLKIRYMEYGDPNFDSFYLKVGNLKTMTIGHGLLMYNYANDADFPSIRKVGINTGVALGDSFGVEAVVDDLAEPDIFGGRVWVAPFSYKTFKIGATGIIDTKPAEDMEKPLLVPESAAEYWGDPIFTTVGADVELIKIKTGILNALVYGDIGVLFPYYRVQPTAVLGPELVEAGLASDYFFYDNQLQNYGASAGLLGKLLFIDYRLEYRYAKGVFKSPFFNTSYDRNKGENVVSTLAYLNDPTNPDFDVETMGIFGNAGASLFDALYLEGGYFWPWERDDQGEITTSDNDFLSLKLRLEKGVIPVVGIYGSLSYERSKFAPTIMGTTDQDLHLFDANTVLKGEVVYPIDIGLDIAILVATTTLRDDEGNIQYNSDGTARVVPTFNIETRVSF